MRGVSGEFGRNLGVSGEIGGQTTFSLEQPCTGWSRRVRMGQACLALRRWGKRAACCLYTRCPPTRLLVLARPPAPPAPPAGLWVCVGAAQLGVAQGRGRQDRGGGEGWVLARGCALVCLSLPLSKCFSGRPACLQAWSWPSTSALRQSLGLFAGIYKILPRICQIPSIPRPCCRRRPGHGLQLPPRQLLLGLPGGVLQAGAVQGKLQSLVSRGLVSVESGLFFARVRRFSCNFRAGCCGPGPTRRV